MKRWLIVLAVSLGLLAPAAAFWQSRDSNYNVAISTSGALSCSYTPVTTGTQGTAYTGATPSASGGTPAYTFSETGTLPGGLSISSSTGVISGTPTANGSFPSIQVKVTDSASNTVNCGAAFTLVISPAASFSLVLSSSVAGPPATGSPTDFGTMAYGSGNTAVIAMFLVDAGSGYTISGVTIGGVALTHVGSTFQDANGSAYSDIWMSSGPLSGTSGDVQVINSGVVLFDQAAALYTLKTTTPTPAASGGNTSGFSSTVSFGPYTIPTGGGSIFASFNPSGVSGTPSNGVIDATVTGASNMFLFGHTTSTGSITETITYSSSQFSPLSVAAWGP